MLATTTKPYNPNKNRSLDTDWDQIDLCSFLRNINNINIDQNDVSFTGKDYLNATNREIVAEIIRTINATHYNSLLGMKDIINFNNNLIKITEGKNKSIAICNKKVKRLEAKIFRIDFLLSKAAKLLPAVPLQDYQTMEKAQNILHNTSCNDLIFTKDDFKLDFDTEQNIQDIKINSTQPSSNDINNCIDTNDTIKPIQKPPKQLQSQFNQPSQILPAHISQSISQAKNPSAILREQIKPKKEPLLASPTKSKPLPPKHSQPQHTQNVSALALSSIGGVTNTKTIEQLQPQLIQPSEPIKHIDITNEIINDIIIPTKLSRGTEISKNDPQLKSSIKIQNIDDIHLKLPQDIKPNKMKKKSKNKNKKNNYNNKKRRKYRKPKPKPKSKPKPKPKLLKDKQKKNILSIDENMLTMDQMNEMIQHYEFTDDQYQDFMNLRLFQRSGLSPYEYYKEIYGPITDEKIKEWSSVHHSN